MCLCVYVFVCMCECLGEDVVGLLFLLPEQELGAKVVIVAVDGRNLELKA